MEDVSIPAMGHLAFEPEMSAEMLYRSVQLWPEELRDLGEDFAHDLAVIRGLPSTVEP